MLHFPRRGARGLLNQGRNNARLASPKEFLELRGREHEYPVAAALEREPRRGQARMRLGERLGAAADLDEHAAVGREPWERTAEDTLRGLEAARAALERKRGLVPVFGREVLHLAR